ncbi:Multidrug resistance-associated protein 4, partial [Kappamyces sp. JEL0680]
MAQFLSECLVSIKRIEQFMMLPELDENADQSQHPLFSSPEHRDAFLIMENASFGLAPSQPDSEPLELLHKLSFECKKQSLTFVCGTVGAGKTSLLNAILGDMKLLSGDKILKSRKLAYVSQTPWILSGSIQENILFGQAFDQDRFDKVIACCALERDLQLFPDGAATFIGERGVTLSGGQKARVALARAVYHDADLYLLDDPLAAVDTKVARHIFEQCIQKVLGPKCVVLVTHQVQFSKYADQILVLEDGMLVQKGGYSDIIASDSAFAKSIQQVSSQSAMDDIDDIVQKTTGAAQEHDTKTTKGFANEESAIGVVSLSTYWKFFGAGATTFLATLFVVGMVGGTFMSIYSDIWLSNWSSIPGAPYSTNLFYAYMSVIIALIVLLSIFGRTVIFFLICIRSTRRMFTQMIDAVFASPMSFFHANPAGRILNRFSKDTNMVDENLPQVFIDFLSVVFLMLGVLAIIAYSIPWLLLSFPFLAFGLIKLRNYYMLTTRQVKRMESTTRSPVYSNVPSTLEGLSIIRAFGAQERIKQGFFADQDNNSRMFFMFITAGRWIGLRLDFAVSLMSAIIIFGSVALQGSLGLSPSLVGLLMTYLTKMLATLQWGVRQSSEVENLFI